jgi:hypothetical protein
MKRVKKALPAAIPYLIAAPALTSCVGVAEITTQSPGSFHLLWSAILFLSFANLWEKK